MKGPHMQKVFAENVSGSWKYFELVIKHSMKQVKRYLQWPRVMIAFVGYHYET